MTQIKHVLVLLLLVFPMFALAPSLVAGSNEAFTNLAEIETSIPAQFVEETLRVAVYAETNTTLPSYASGGVSTANHANLIQFLGTNGFAVTPLSTQDILDHKLMAARFDVFILPNNLPKDEIVNQVKDYWLAGGGILSFDSGLGYLYYHGMIVAGETGDYALLNVDVNEHWGFDYVENITVGARHSTAKGYQANDIIVAQENITIHDRAHFSDANVEDFVPLLIEQGNPSTTVGFALDNSARQGGRIVQLPGNCSEIRNWEKSIIIDSIDWLAPRPKANIAIDYTHVPYYGIDTWDENVTHAPRYNLLRDFAVNHSFTFDKLYPKASGELTAADIAPFDVLMLDLPNINYTIAEMAVIKDWVENGGGLFVLGDYVLPMAQQNLNELMSDWGLAISQGYANMPTPLPTSEFEDHPVLEGISSLYFWGGEWLNISGDAYPIAKSGSNIALAGAKAGNGRIILSGDINFLSYEFIDDYNDNIQFSINLFNWISSGLAKVLVFTDRNPATQPNYNYYRSELVLALNGLGIPFYMTNDVDYFNLSLATESWELVISDANYHTAVILNEPRLLSHMESGGKLIMRDWRFRYTGYPLWHYLGFEGMDSSISAGPPTIHLWTTEHPIFSLPADYGETSINSTNDYFGTDFTYVSLFNNATGIAGITESYDENASAIVLGVGGRAICNMFSISEYTEDTDDSTYSDAFELFTNEIAYLYFDRPTINHPDDVTYMETETGNEITWTPTADAGPWEYVLRVNGSVDTTAHWSGGAITINVDGVNASITEYQLTVYDRLGYSVSDIVTLNVTEYIEPGPTFDGFDPLILVVIAGIGIVVIIIVIVMVKKKK